jgi:hypothetical protein
MVKFLPLYQLAVDSTPASARYEYIGVSVPKMEAISPEKLRHGSIFTLVNYSERSGPFPGVN